MENPSVEPPSCSVCGRQKDWHDANDTVHAFTTREGGSAFGPSRERRTSDEKRPSAVPDDAPAVMRWPFDPVLRQALVDKGILTVEDLEAAEQKIRTASMVMGGQQ